MVIICAVGIGLLLYPSFSSWYNSLHQSRAIASYQEAVEDLTDEEYEAALAAAREYNEWLFEGNHSLSLSEEEEEEYLEILDVDGSGIIGYIEIPSIDVYLPIYHTTEDTILAVAVGHLEGSSFPVGGENTHAVLAGHTGLPTAALFTDIDQLEEGDVFYIYVLDEMYTYEVDQVVTVLPDDAEDYLDIEEGEDYVTLYTCTPYGLNTHRLLVRGTRTANPTEEEMEEIEEENRFSLDRDEIAVLCAIAALIALIVILIVRGARKHRNSKKAASEAETGKELKPPEK